VQPVHDIPDMAALAVGYSHENVALGFGGHKNFRGFILDFFRDVHTGFLVIVPEKLRIA
jgi:hypothetical protein